LGQLRQYKLDARQYGQKLSDMQARIHVIHTPTAPLSQVWHDFLLRLHLKAYDRWDNRQDLQLLPS